MSGPPQVAATAQSQPPDRHHSNDNHDAPTATGVTPTAAPAVVVATEVAPPASKVVASAPAAAASRALASGPSAATLLHALPRVCGHCGRGGAISRCSKCLAIYYCTQQCQASDWKRHKAHCVRSTDQHRLTHTPRSAASAVTAATTALIPPTNSAAVAPPSSTSTRSSTASSTAGAVVHATPSISASTTAATTTTRNGADSPPPHSYVSPYVSPAHTLHPGRAESPPPHPYVSPAHAVHAAHAATVVPASVSHACTSTSCPHHGAANKAQAASRAAAAAAAAATSALSPLPSSSHASGTALPSAASAAAPTPVHSQTSYSPVPVSNVSASSRHIYVPPCRPPLRPSFLSFPPSHGPPLSCIHGFHTNLLFSHEPVRILYADLVDPRHVLQSLVDLHTKMKAWKKKNANVAAAAAAAASNANATNGTNGDKTKRPPPPPPPSSSSSKSSRDPLSLPTPPSLASAKNPNVGIEFHLNDANPHGLARSILFLVASYMSSAVLNQSRADDAAHAFGITLRPECVHAPATHAAAAAAAATAHGSAAATAAAAAASSTNPTAAASTVPPCVLSSYAHWTPSDHWAYLFALYGCFQVPSQFLRRTRETLELLVRLVGADTVEMERRAAANASANGGAAAGGGSSSHSSAAHHPLGAHEATLFSSHPYTFFLHLPSLTLAVLVPIWRAWEAACSRALSHAASNDGAYRVGPVEPIFTEKDVTTAHPAPKDADLRDTLNTFYQRGAVRVRPRHFPRTHVMRTREEWTDLLKRETEEAAAAAAAAQVTATNDEDGATEETKEDGAATTTAATTTATPTLPRAASRRSPLASSSSSSLGELLPPSLEEYERVEDFLIQPPSAPFNFSSSHLTTYSAIMPSSASAANATTTTNTTSGGANGTSTASAASASSEIDARRMLADASPRALFAREPFSRLLARLSDGPNSNSTASANASTTTAAEAPSKKTTDSRVDDGGVVSASMDLMSKMSHALFWVVAFQQPATAAASASSHVIPSAVVAPSTSRLAAAANKVPYVRLYFYNHDLYFHLHTYDFLYDRILVYHLPPYAGMQPLVLMARHRMKNQDSLLECAMNFPSCLSSTTGAPDLAQFCLLSLNANAKLLRNIYGWDLAAHTYSFAAASGGGATAAATTTVLRFTVCDYSLDLSAPVGHVSDGFRVMNDWLMTAVQPILLHDQFSTLRPDERTLLRATTPRSVCNLRTFCLLIGLLIKQGHLDQAPSRRRMVQLFSSILAPNSAYAMDHLFTSFLTHIGLLKAELLPLMYLLLAPGEETSPETMAHNALFFKGLWQLDLVSMKFEPLLPAFHAQATTAAADMERTRSASDERGEDATMTPSQSGDASAVASSTEPTTPPKEFDATCRLCALCGPAHAHHASHAPVRGGDGPAREPLLSLLFVTDPKLCPSPVSAFSSSTATTSTATASATTTATSPPPTVPLVPGQVPSASPLAWVNLREGELLRWLRAAGRSVQVLDIVDVDWTSGIVTAWCNRTYVNYVRKCSAFAQVCVIDFEQMRVVAPPRSIVHLKTMRSMNIR